MPKLNSDSILEYIDNLIAQLKDSVSPMEQASIKQEIQYWLELFISIEKKKNRIQKFNKWR